MANKVSLPFIFVIGNEKGGVGKTTCCMHLISALLLENLNVTSIDIDGRQKSLTSYIANRIAYNKSNPGSMVPISQHFVVEDQDYDHAVEKEQKELEYLQQIFTQADNSDVIVIDTPGAHSHLSRVVHAYADTIITPINDSFVDIDLLAKVDPIHMKVLRPSIYSEMIWKQKLIRAKNDNKSIDWIVMRNRLSNLNANNKVNVSKILEELSQRVNFTVAPGFSERVIFRELFLQGLTLLDLGSANYSKPFTASNVAARQELRNFIKCLGIDRLVQVKNNQVCSA